MTVRDRGLVALTRAHSPDLARFTARLVSNEA